MKRAYKEEKQVEKIQPLSADETESLDGMIIIIQKEVSLAARLSYNAGGKHLAVGRRSSNSEMFTEVREAQAF